MPRRTPHDENRFCHGGGGADVINAGGGNDTVTYRGTESSIDGGAGSDTLVLAAAGGITSVNFAVAAGSDQTGGDSVSVANFENQLHDLSSFQIRAFRRVHADLLAFLDERRHLDHEAGLHLGGLGDI